VRILRHELKYIIREAAYLSLKSRIRAAMKPDVHADAKSGLYRVTSLYFDDAYRSAYNDKLAGIEKRRKFRIRAYNLEPETLRLEIKYKDGEYVSKKSAKITYEQYAAMLKGEYRLEESRINEADEVAEEFLISHKLTRQRPSVITDYFRDAYVCAAGNVRVTFDARLSTCLNGLDMFRAKASPVLSDIILEIKYDRFLPAHIADLFSGYDLYRQNASKFILCTQKLTEVKKQCIITT